MKRWPGTFSANLPPKVHEFFWKSPKKRQFLLGFWPPNSKSGKKGPLFYGFLKQKRRFLKSFTSNVAGPLKMAKTAPNRWIFRGFDHFLTNLFDQNHHFLVFSAFFPSLSLFLFLYLSSSILSGIEAHVHTNSLDSMASLVCDESHYQTCFGISHQLKIG